LVINMLTGMAVANRAIILNSDGLSWRPNLHIFDACESIRCAIDLDYQGGDLLILNVGTNEDNLQVIDIADIVKNAVSNCEVMFLASNPELDKEGLIRDRKIKEGSDTRTYRVCFDKIKVAMPAFKCTWNVERGVRDLATRLNQIPLTTEVFKRRGFYRLQQLEYLYENGHLTDELVVKNGW
jgi:nucleoside-diphosphate-sugar epimerase